MGWTFVQTNETPKQFLDRNFKGWEGKEFSTKMLVSGFGKNAYYAAMETTPKDGVIGRQKEVWCLVCLYKKRKTGWLNEVGYKDMSEHCGPIEYDVPNKVWEVLEANKEFAPTDKYAVEWRQEVEKRRGQPKLRPLKEGDFIQFDEPLQFANGINEDLFKVLQAGQKKLFESCHHGFRCRIRRDTLRLGSYKIRSGYIFAEVM